MPSHTAQKFSLQYWSISQSPCLHKSLGILNRHICSFLDFSFHHVLSVKKKVITKFLWIFFWPFIMHIERKIHFVVLFYKIFKNYFYKVLGASNSWLQNIIEFSFCSYIIHMGRNNSLSLFLAHLHKEYGNKFDKIHDFCKTFFLTRYVLDMGTNFLNSCFLEKSFKICSSQ